MLTPINARLAADRATKVAAATLLLLFTAPVCFGQALILTEPFAFRTAIQEATAALEGMLGERALITEVRAANGDPLGDLSAYQCVWDLRIDNDLSAAEFADLTLYAQGGGSMYFAGEHATFDHRNASVLGLIIALGGGAPLSDSLPGFSATPVDYPEIVNQAHRVGTDCQVATEVVYDGVDHGNFLDVGFGIPLTQTPSGDNIGAIYMDQGTMFGALTAKAAVVLDINWLATEPGTGTLDFHVDGVTPTQNRTLVRNLINDLCGLCCTGTAPLDPLPPLATRGALAALPPASPASPCSAKSTPSSKSTFAARRYFGPSVGGRSRGSRGGNAGLVVLPTNDSLSNRPRPASDEQHSIPQP